MEMYIRKKTNFDTLIIGIEKVENVVGKPD